MSKQYSEKSKQKLKDSVVKKLKTVMIGALNSIEVSFEEELKDIRFAKVYGDLRKQILDNGNKQIRDLEEELESYDIEWFLVKPDHVDKRYHYTLRVKPEE